MSVKVITGDCVEALRTLSAGSVELCVTSPPYDALRSYGGYTWDFEATAIELYRVLCDGGVICWNVGDSVVDGSESLTSFQQALFFREQVGFLVHDTMIYEKVNATRPAVNRYHQMFEYVFILSRGRPRCFNPIKDKPNVYAGSGTFGKNTARQSDGTMRESPRNIIADFGMRGNIWRGNTAGQENVCQPIEHPATMPRWLATDLIRSWSNEGDTVLDPMCGSGTSGLAADRLQRNAILIDVNPEYAQLARDRITTDAGMFAEVA